MTRLRIIGVMQPRLLCLALAALVVPARAQGGYDTEEHADLGLTFPRARHYEALPTQPNETSVVLRFAEKQERSKKAGRRVIPQMWIVQLTPEGEQDPELPRSLDEYLERSLAGWSKGEPLEQESKQGWTGTEFELVQPDLSNVRGWAYAWERSGERTIAVLGTCARSDFDEQAKIWRLSATRMKISEPSAAREAREREKWTRYYERRRFLDTEHRVRVRLSLTEGWKAEDTKHYIVVTDSPDKPLLRRVLRDLELLHEEYERLFPPTAPIAKASTVRICKDRIEYLQYSGAEGSVGYWSAETGELVLFDATTQEKNERKDREDTYLALYHEAFHQYIHYSAGELAPHPWFNEGFGDYFSGAVLSKGKLLSIGENDWRLPTIQQAVERSQHVPWRDIVRYEQDDYYANAALCYAQGWSMVYFLNTSKEVQRHPAWSRIVPTYFEELRRAYAHEFERIREKGGAEDEEWLAAAQIRSRQLAADVAFDGVDLDELELAWIEWVRSRSNSLPVRARRANR